MPCTLNQVSTVLGVLFFIGTNFEQNNQQGRNIQIHVQHFRQQETPVLKNLISLSILQDIKKIEMLHGR